MINEEEQIKKIIDKMNESIKKWDTINNILNNVSIALEKFTNIVQYSSQNILSVDNTKLIAQNIDSLSNSIDIISKVKIPADLENTVTTIHQDSGVLFTKLKNIDELIKEVDNKLSSVKEIEVLNQELNYLNTNINILIQSITFLKNSISNETSIVNNLRAIMLQIKHFSDEQNKLKDFCNNIKNDTSNSKKLFNDLLREWYKENVGILGLKKKK